MASKLPKKLKHDSITEAVFEVRFHVDEPDEVILARLLNARTWKNWKRSRLPFADFPPTVRSQDPSLRFQAFYDLRNPETDELIKIGPNVLSCHVVRHYPGWNIFSRLISKGLTALFTGQMSISIHRLGLRYINALTNEEHSISSPYDLTIQLSVRNARPSDNVNLNYSVKNEYGMEALGMEGVVRVASRSFVSGSIPENATAYVDIDVHTSVEPENLDRASAMNWVKTAHDFEKEQYFKLIPDEIIETLRA